MTAPFVAWNRTTQPGMKLGPSGSSNRIEKSAAGNERSEFCRTAGGPLIVATGPSRSQTNRAGRLSRRFVGSRAAPPRRSMVIVPEAAGFTSTR